MTVSIYIRAMKKILLIVALLMIGAVAGWADTLYLRNGSTLRGRFLGYENGQFLFELENGESRRYRTAEVVRLVMEREERVVNEPPGDVAGRWEVLPTVEVRLAEQWIKTGIQLHKGTRVRLAASGTINLDGRTPVRPDGLSGRRDPDAPMPQQNDGALIAIIGQAEDSPAILVGREREFTAEIDGTLYLTVNHWETRNASGAFRVEVSIDRSGESSSGAGGAGGAGSGETAGGREKLVTVSSSAPWTDTGIDVTPNMTFEIVAEGTIEIGNRVTSGPDGVRNGTGRTRLPVNDRGPGALIARIRYRDGRFSNTIGLGARSTPATEEGEYGRLFLGVNDDNFDDNRGSYSVRIRWQELPGTRQLRR